MLLVYQIRNVYLYAKVFVNFFYGKVQGPWICFEIGMQFSQPFLVDCTSSLQMPTFVSTENLLKFFYLSIKNLWWMKWIAIMQILIKGPAGEGFLALERRQKRVVFKNCIFILSSNFTFFCIFFARWEGIHFIYHY